MGQLRDEWQGYPPRMRGSLLGFLALTLLVVVAIMGWDMIPIVIGGDTTSATAVSDARDVTVDPDGGRVYRADIQFVATNGDLVRTDVHVPPSTRVGDRISVTYATANPENATTESMGFVTATLAVMLGGALVLVVWAVIEVRRPVA